MNLTLTRTPGVLFIQPAPEYVRKYLQYSHRSFQKIKYKTENYYEQRLLFDESPGGIATYGGFFEKIRAKILKEGDTVEIADHRLPMPVPDLKALRDMNWKAIGSTGLRPYQFEPVAKLISHLQHDGGIVHATGGMGKTIVSACVYAAFNSLNTILVVPSKTLLNQTYQKFAKLFPDKQIGIVGDGKKAISEDLTISTYASLDVCSLEKCQLLLCDEIQRATGDRTKEILTSFIPLRTVGFSATIHNLFNQADKLLRGMFGEVIVSMNYEEAKDAGAVVPGYVYMIDVPAESCMVTATEPRYRIVQGIEENKFRNKMIGQICASIPRHYQTMIMVDHIETHLIPLYKQLPVGTKFLHRNSDKELNGFCLKPKQQAKVLEDFCNNEFQHLLVTDMAREGFSHDNVRVVIQATGGSSEVELLQEAFRASRIMSEAEQERLDVPPKTHFVLVDFVDHQDEFLESLSYKRMLIYKKMGWKVIQTNDIKTINWENPVHNQANGQQCELAF